MNTDRFGEQEASIEERVTQGLGHGEFFLKVMSKGQVDRLKSNIVRERALGGDVVQISETWAMSIEEAEEYLVDQLGEISAYSALDTLFTEVKEGKQFTDSWKQEDRQEKWKSSAYKGTVEIEGTKYFMYETASLYVSKKGYKLASPQSMLITEKDYDSIQLRVRLNEIKEERKAAATVSSELGEF